jgi:hypothetical protein
MHVDPDRPAVLDHTDQGMISDRDGRTHSVFEQNRRVLMLSVPKEIDLRTASAAAQDLVDVIAAAMERP